MTIALTTIDQMEYASDGQAQAAFVSNGGIVLNTTYSQTLNSDYSGATHNQRIILTAAELSNSGSYIRIKLQGNSSAAALLNGASIGSRSGTTGNFASTPTRITFGGNNYATVPSGSGFIYSDWMAFTLDESANYLVHLAFITAGQCAIKYVASGSRYVLDGSTADYTMTDDISSLGFTNNGYVVSLASVEVADSLATSLEVHSETSTLQSGACAIKGVAVQTTSLNKALTRTIASPIDLTGKTNFVGYIRSSRTGSNIKIGLHDSGGTTTEITPNIASADTWQLFDLDISGVTDANKDAIDQIIITIVNADAANTFYLDNLFAVSDPQFAVSKVVGYAVLSPIQPALNISKLVGYAVLGPYVAPPASDGGPMFWIF